MLDFRNGGSQGECRGRGAGQAYGRHGWGDFPGDPASLRDDLSRVLRDDALVDAAAGINATTARARLDEQIGQKYAFAFYALPSSSDISSA